MSLPQDFFRLPFEVRTDIVGEVVKATDVRSNTSLHSEVFVETIASSESHSLFRFVTPKSDREVEFTNVVRLEETSKSRL